MGATKQTIENIRKLAALATRVPIDTLVENREKWGPITFQGARPDLELIHALANHLQDLPIELVPQGPADAFLTALQAAVETIKLLEDFKIDDGNSPTGRRDQINAQVKAHAEQLLNTTQGWIGFLAYQKGDVQRNLEGLTNAVETAKGLLGNARTDIDDRKKVLDGIISAARDASATVGVAHFTEDFAGQATKFSNEANKWLKWTAGLAAATMIAAVLFYFVPIAATTTSIQLVQYMTSKLVLLGVLITATVWCGRIYRGTRHQAAVNEHRAHALKSFQAFVKATDDDQTRNAVLLETTRSIFAIGPSGFLESGDASSEGSSKVLEIIKSASKG